MGGRVDILAEQKDSNLIIAVECGPCRIRKAIDYLRNPTTELWIIATYYEETLFYIIKRGPNWNKIIQIYDDWQNEELNKIRSPLDTLRERKNE